MNIGLISYCSKLLLRNISKNKILYILSLGSLGVSFAIISLVFQYVINEYKYNSTICDPNRVYKLIRVLKDGDKVGSASFQKGKEIKETFPEIIEVTTCRKEKYVYFENIQLEDFIFTNQEFFSIFNIEIFSGNKDFLLSKPNSIVLSKSNAIKLFGNTDIIGKEFLLNIEGHNYSLTITGVFKDTKKGNTIAPGYLASTNVDIDYIKKMGLEMQAGSYDFMNEIFFLLNKKNNYEPLKTKIAEIKPEYEKFKKYSLQPFKNIYLNPEGVFDSNKHGNIKKIKIIAFLGITVFIVSLLNLLIIFRAHRYKKIKELEIKKIFGVKRSVLTGEYIFESFFFVLITAILGIAITELLKPILENILNTQIIIKNYLGTFLFSISILTIISSLILGLTQRIVLRNHFIVSRPVTKSKYNPMLIIQSTVLFTLIITITLIFIQLNYLFKYDLGFNSKNIICVDNYYFNDKMDVFKSRLYEYTFVKNISSCEHLLPEKSGSITKVECFVKGNENESVNVSYLPVDFGLLDLLCLKMIDGKTFKNLSKFEAFNSIIINEAAVKKFNMTSPLDQYITYEYEDSIYLCKVIGVVKDFYFTTLHTNIEPLIIKIDERLYDTYYTYIKLNEKISNQNITKIIDILTPFFPEQIKEEVIVLDDYVKTSYKKDIELRNIFSFISILLFIILYLGLFSQSFIYIRQNINKFATLSVYGGTYKDLFIFAFKKHYFQIIICLIISIPCSFFLFNIWGQNFYIQYSPDILAIAPILILSFLLGLLPIFISILKIKRTRLILSLKNDI